MTGQKLGGRSGSVRPRRGGVAGEARERGEDRRVGRTETRRSAGGPRVGRGLWSVLGGVALLAGCLSARAVERNFFMLHGEPIPPPKDARPVDGLVRVRDMDTPSVYEKFQIVVRRSPYQLRYSDQNVWAVKPNQMVSDVLANALESSSAFTGVTRQLLDARPAYTLSGKVQAIELYDSGDLWFAHLSLTLHLTRFGDGASVWAFEYDERKQIAAGAFDHGVRALSELLYEAVSTAIREMHATDALAGRRVSAPLRRADRTRDAPGAATPAGQSESDDADPDVMYVPEPLIPAPSGVPAGSITSSTADEWR